VIEASIASPRRIASDSCALRMSRVITPRSALLTIRDQKVPSWRTSGAIGITSVIYVEDVDGVGVFIDRIADAVLAAPGSPLSLEGLAQGVPTLRGSSLSGPRMNSKQAHATTSGSRS